MDVDAGLQPPPRSHDIRFRGDAHRRAEHGSCFSKLIPTLQTEGHDVMASQHGLDSLATDGAAVKACLARVPSPAILVGHSYGEH